MPLKYCLLLIYALSIIISHLIIKEGFDAAGYLGLTVDGDDFEEIKKNKFVMRLVNAVPFIPIVNTILIIYSVYMYIRIKNK